MTILITKNGGSKVDTCAPARKTFQPDYGIEGPAVRPWYERVPPLKYFVIVGVVIGLAVGVHRLFN